MSKGLEAFEEIKTVMTKLFGNVEKCVNSLAIVEKSLKALEVINEHTMYLENVNTFVFVDLSESDKDLLKEVLI